MAVLYRKYRPQNFDEMVGQENIVDALKRSVAADKSPHALLFVGPKGSGKTTTARIFAKAINCPNVKEGNPCGVCDVCEEIASGASVDVIEIDGASNRKIDDIREIRDKISHSPSKFKKKVYIIDEVHMLTKEAFNALLKTLEEPPSHAVFVLCTTESDKLPATIISRCQRFDFNLGKDSPFSSGSPIKILRRLLDEIERLLPHLKEVTSKRVYAEISASVEIQVETVTSIIATYEQYGLIIDDETTSRI